MGPAGQSEQEQILHPMLESVFRALNGAGICWCLVRTPSSLSAPTGDVDVLIQRADIAASTRILARLGFGRIPVVGLSSEAYFRGYHAATDHSICLHVATDLAFGPGHLLETHAETGCLERRVQHGSVMSLAPDDAFWAMLLHGLLDKRRFSTAHRNSLRDLLPAAGPDGELARVVAAACPEGWDPGRILHGVESGEWALLTTLGEPLANKWPFRRHQSARQAFTSWGFRTATSIVNAVCPASWRRYVWRASRLLLVHQVNAGAETPGAARRGPSALRSPFRRLSPPGLTVALLGPDGAGKSTLAAGIESSFCLPVRLVYLGLGRASLPRLCRIPVPGVREVLIYLTLWTRYLSAQLRRQHGALVIFDRYPYDGLLAPDRPLSRVRRAVRWVWAHSFPAPDLVLVLDAPGEVLFRRKGQSTIEKLEAERLGFVALRARLSNVQVIDATQFSDSVRDEALEQICSMHRRRGGICTRRGICPIERGNSEEVDRDGHRVVRVE